MFNPPSEKELARLRPGDHLTLFHGTSNGWAVAMMDGFDAGSSRRRNYGGSNHRGLFVAPSPRGASKFGGTLLALRLPVRELKATDWGGNTGKDAFKYWSGEANETVEDIPDMYPRSERPYLSHSLLRRVEPQALFLGTASPDQVLGLRKSGKWYRRQEFLEEFRGKTFKIPDGEVTVGGPVLNRSDRELSVEDVVAYFKEKGHSQEKTERWLGMQATKAKHRENPVAWMVEELERGRLGVPLDRGPAKHLAREVIDRFGGDVSASSSPDSLIVKRVARRSLRRRS